MSPVAAGGCSSCVEWVAVGWRSKLVWSNYEYARETVYLVPLGIAIAEPIRRAGQEHVYQLTFEDLAMASLDLAQANNFPPSSDGGDVHQVKRFR